MAVGSLIPNRRVSRSGSPPLASALAGQPVGAQLLGGDPGQAQGGLDVAAADGHDAAGGAPVDQQVRVGGGGPAGSAGVQPAGSSL
jgi:hypothetical protein